MKSIVLAVAACLGSLAFVASSSAEEVRPLEFIHALQERDYHDMAVEYLKMLQGLPQMPAEVADVFDLEMSRSLQGAAKRAFNPREAEDLTAQAEKYLNKFLKEKPNHPEAVSAAVSYGVFAVDRALGQMRNAKAIEETDKAQSEKLRTDARTALEDARPRFQKAIDEFRKKLAALPPVPANRRQDSARAERDRLDMALVNGLFQSALVDYYVAQTYPDKKAEPRKAALKRAAKSFDNIFQTHRVDAQGRVSVIGLTAHMWHGKAVDDLGDDDELAFAIYEEVLANELDPKTEDRMLDPLFAQVRQFYFDILKRKYPKQYLPEAREWLDAYSRKSRRYEGYQAVAIDVAKILLAEAEKAKPADKTKLVNDAMVLLGEMTRIPSPYQQEAFNLRKKHGREVVTDLSGAKSFEDAVNLAQTAADAGQWKDAEAGFAKALELSSGTKDEARLAAVRNALARCRLMLASELVRENKLEESLTALGRIVAEQKDTESAAAASAMAAQVALGLYSAVPANDAAKKQAALARLQKIVQVTESNWPGKPEADDARLVLGKVSLVERKFDDAIGVFEKVNPRSDRYAGALYLAGYAYWQRYVAGKTGQEQRTEEQLKADRATAVERATASLAELKRRPPEKEKGDKQAAEKQLIDTSLLLADIALEGNQPKEAVGYVEPLLSLAQAAQGAKDTQTAFRIYFAATRVFLTAGDTDRAGSTGMALAECGADIPQVNFVLVEFARSLDIERKKADAAVTQAKADKDEKATADAEAKLASTQKMMGALLKKLAERKQHTLGGKMAIADLCMASSFDKDAGKLYAEILESPNLDAKAATRARAQLVSLLRREGDYPKAYAQVNQLIKDNPRALEPQLEKGRVLQSWAEQDPKHYEEAAGQWIQIRNWLQPMRKKPLEYYEVIYNAAFCLAQSGDKDKRTQALQLLKGTLILNEQLTGPDMVAKYKTLIAQLEGK